MKERLLEARGGCLKVWDPPLPASRYCIGCDPATGKIKDRKRSAAAELYSYTDKRPDYTAVAVVEVETGKHVASWHGYIVATELYPKLAALGYHYNNALIVVESNPPVGPTVVEGLTMVLHYPNVYRSKVWNKPDRDMLGGDWGWATTMHSRPLLIARIEEQLMENTLFTRDKDLIRELRTIQIDETGVPRAKGKDKDDRVFALGMALQGRFEMLYGTLNSREDQELSGLPELDQMAWRHVRNQQAQTEDRSGSSYRGFRRGMRRLPGLGRVARR